MAKENKNLDLEEEAALVIEEGEACEKCPKCLPTYLQTFADLMALLLCFFVLLFSFAEVDAAKYRLLAISFESAFGVSSEDVPDSLKGVSLIKFQFSPLISEPEFKS
ncbi:MAG: hypothetical protein HN790_15040 [Methylococcales bacterium]|jgi:chemotaxis protein MotB|nr:hypothetical protein [Methylococcales bacterium]